MVEAYRLARKHGNLKLATSLIQNHIFNLVEVDSEMSELGLSEAVEALRSSKNISPEQRFLVMRDLSKLFATLQQNNRAVDTLATSMGIYCEALKNQSKSNGSVGVLNNEMIGRSLLTLVKWLQSDPRLLALLWRTDFDMGRKLDLLLTQEVECRRNRMGLYKNSESSEAWELFQPDESVAR